MEELTLSSPAKMEVVEPEMQRAEIKTVDELNNYIENLQANASNSVASALNAQLQVIRYVSSPKLVDSAFDLVFKHLQQSLDSADDESAKEKIREMSQLMIHNYIFFLNAKLEYAKNKNREAGQAVLGEATKELLKSSVSVIKLGESSLGLSDKNSIGGKAGDNAKNFLSNIGNPVAAATGTTVMTAVAAIYVAAVAADFIKNITVEGGVWDKAVDWAFAAKKNRKSSKEFIGIVDAIFKKLEKYKQLIGKSNLMSDLIDRYSTNLIEVEHRAMTRNANIRSIVYKPILFIAAAISAAGLALLQLIFKGTTSAVNALSSASAVQPEVDYSQPWMGLALIAVAAYSWIEYPKRQCKKKIALSNKKYKELSTSFIEN